MTQLAPNRSSTSRADAAQARRNARRYAHNGPTNAGPKLAAPLPHPAARAQSRNDRQPKNNLLQVTAQVLAIIAAFASLSMSLTTDNPADRQLVIAIAVIMLLLTLRLSEAPITSNLNRESNA